ncbi:unnamed protein product [Mytilus edulis]|uniref:Uncharacterized protein n=1 Tax=Mytilus edulis TaxID=6550 RepID=A0A8S3QV11_MYTED|nr:unnamed protein product [Mytilus edulis]
MEESRNENSPPVLTVHLTWIKVKEPDTSSRKPEPALISKNKPPSTRRRNANRYAKWMATKTAVVPAAEHQQTTSKDHITQTEARDTIVCHVLTPTNPYNPNKACHRLVYYTSTTDRGKRSRIDFDINDYDLLTTPSHTSQVSIESKEAMQAAILAERPDTPYQPQHRSRSKMKAKRQTDPNLTDANSTSVESDETLQSLDLGAYALATRNRSSIITYVPILICYGILLCHFVYRAIVSVKTCTKSGHTGQPVTQLVSYSYERTYVKWLFKSNSGNTLVGIGNVQEANVGAYQRFESYRTGMMKRLNDSSPLRTSPRVIFTFVVSTLILLQVNNWVLSSIFHNIKDKRHKLSI